MLFKLVPRILIAWLGTNVCWIGILAVIPSFPSQFWLNGIISLVIFIVIFSCLRFYRDIPLIPIRIHWVILTVFIGVGIIRAPMVYPTYDDFAGHYLMGGYMQSIWTSPNFMPLDFGTYFPAVVDMSYTPLLTTIGLRATIFIFHTLLSIWLVSLLIRFQSQSKNSTQTMFLLVTFIFTFFYPHLMAVHGTLMTDYISLVIILEAYYLLKTKGGTSLTWGVLVSILIVLTKQSTSIFVLPLLVIYTLLNYRHIKWLYVGIACLIAGLYFGRLWHETGNPLFGLYNSIFQSSLYPLADFKNPLFGPRTSFELAVWPVIAQFTDRYGEGAVSSLAQIVFSWLSILGYCGSIYLFWRKRSLEHLMIVVGYILWSAIAGYSRYYIPLNTLALIVISESLRFKIKPLYAFAAVPLVTFLALSSIKTDFAWRPYPSLRTPSANVYFLAEYREGLGLVFRDTLPALAEEIRHVYKDYDAIVIAFRGQSSLIGYLAYTQDGIPVYNGVTSDKKRLILSDQSISSHIKDTLHEQDSKDHILLLADSSYSSVTESLDILKSHTCTTLPSLPASRFMQREYFYTDILAWECKRRQL